MLIASCFGGSRNEIIADFFRAKGIEVLQVESDYDHINKAEKAKRSTVKYIKVIKYKKNISVKRIVSHYFFAVDLLKILQEYKPDIVYVAIPPNFIAYFIVKYKISFPNVKLYFDIIDLWPESMPFSRFFKQVFFPRIWKALRNDSLKYVDKIIIECDLYKSVLPKPCETLYLSTTSVMTLGDIHIDDYCNKLEICYLGSINHIIDIDIILLLVNLISKYKHLVFHIIGDGEKRNFFLEKLAKYRIEVIFHGKVFDSSYKKKIFEHCAFGINMLKDITMVGLTTKSIDYFAYGIPILNTIKGDTWNIVEKEHIGFNITPDNLELTTQEICGLDNISIYNMRINTYKVYEKYFSKKAFHKRLTEIFEDK